MGQEMRYPRLRCLPQARRGIGEVKDMLNRDGRWQRICRLESTVSGGKGRGFNPDTKALTQVCQSKLCREGGCQLTDLFLFARKPNNRPIGVQGMLPSLGC